MTEFITWEILATYAGATLMVAVLTQFTKGLEVISKLPTQIWSYILSLVVLYPAMLFTGQLNANTAVLTIFNAVIVSIAANGGWEAVQRFINTKTNSSSTNG